MGSVMVLVSQKSDDFKTRGAWDSKKGGGGTKNIKGEEGRAVLMQRVVKTRVPPAKKGKSYGVSIARVGRRATKEGEDPRGEH